MRVAVIGAGVIGVTTAYELGADGHDVTVFERRGTVAAESSFANAGLVAPGYVSPWSAPGMPGKVLSHLWREHAPVRVPRVEPPELHAQDRRLQGVELRVGRQVPELVLADLPEVPQHGDLLGERAVRRRDHAAVAEPAQVLGRMEAEAAGEPERAGPPPVRAARAVRLGGVLEQQGTAASARLLQPRGR